MNAKLIQQIRQCPNLPSLPAIAVQVLELAQKADADIAEIARLISKDPALSSKILRTVNSSFYGRSNNVATISQALVILGLQSVKTLVLGFSLVGNLAGQKPQGFQHVIYWKRSVYAATAARLIGARLKLVQQEEAFLAALLQDIGMLVLDKVLGDEYGPIHDKLLSHADLAPAEQKAIGTNHAEVGGFLAVDWKLPPVLTIPISNHHAPDKVTDPQMRKLTEIVELTSLCADVFVEELAAQPIAEVRKLCGERHQINEADCDTLLEEIGRNTREVASLFEISIGKGESFEHVLKKANDALVAITVDAQKAATKLVQPPGAQEPRSGQSGGTDPLTGLADRQRMETFLAEQFASTAKQGGSLALVMMDVDKMGTIEQKHGRPTATKLIQALGAMFRSAARPSDLAGRSGDDELMLVLPGTSRATAAAIAESIRRAIAAKPLACGAEKLPVTASVGVACFEPGGPLKDAAHLFKAAKLAVDAAKQAGRNRVRIFFPKAQMAA